MQGSLLTLSLLVASGAALVSACGSGGSVQCKDNSSCDLASGGMCLGNPGTTHQWCGYPDADCPSGYRWSELDVGDGVGGRCVDPRALDKTPPIITGRNPAPESQEVSPAEVISVMFSEEIEPMSITASSLRLEDQSGRAVDVVAVTRGSEVVLAPKVPLDPRLSYRVTVTGEVTDLAGNGVPETSFWEFRTRAATWSAPVLLENEQRKKAVSIDVAAAGGVIVAAWASATCVNTTCGLVNEVWAAVRKGGVWGTPTKLSTATDRIVGIRVGASATGRAIAVWGEDGVSGPGKLYASHFDGTSWASSVPLQQNRDRSIRPAQVVAPNDGSFFVVWTDLLLPTRSTFWAARHLPTTGWQAAAGVQIDDGQDHWGPALATSGDSIAMLWDVQSTREISFSQISGVSGTDPAPIATTPAKPMLIAIATGAAQATALWGTDHVMARSQTNGVWDAPTQLDEPSRPPPTFAAKAGSNLAYTDRGTVIAVWATATDTWQAVRPAGQTWGPSFSIDNAADPVEDLQLAAGRSRALALWRTSDVIANEYNDASGWHGAAASGVSTAPVAALAIAYDTETNTFVAVWLQGNAAGLVDVVSSSYR